MARVLHVMEATIGGTRRHLVDVARGQLARGHDVHVAVATSRDPDFAADLAALAAQGVGVLEVPMLREVRLGHDVRHLRVLARHLEALRPDIVHTHSSKAGVLGRLASMQTGIGQRVHTPHTFAFLFEALFGRLKRSLFRTIETELSKSTARVIAVSASEAETFAESGVVADTKIRVVPNGIDPAPFARAEPLPIHERYGLDPDLPTAAVIGLLYAAKGQDIVMESLTRPGCRELQLLIAGPGDDAALRERAEVLGVSDRVRFLGVTREVPGLLAAVDLLILPSRWEGLPYVVLEAMASAKPVVATPVDGARDLVLDGRTGALASAIDPGALAAATARVLALEPAARRALGTRGRERLLAGYSAERMVDGLCAVYAELG